MLCKETCKVLFSLSLTNPVSLVYNGYTIEPNSALAYDPPNLSKWDLFWRSPFGKVLSFRLFVAATVLAVACPGFRELYIGAVTGTVITLCLGGAISGWSRKKNGGEFWEGFACYINENWSQTLAISMALSLVTFGISQAVSAVKAASANKQLANAAKTSQEAALARAKDLQKLHGNKPTMTSAAVDVKSGTIYYSDSGGVLPTNIHPALANQMPAISSTNWAVANCAEFKAVNNALNAGAYMENLVVTTVRVRTLTLAPMCANCQISLQGVLWVVSG